MSSFAPRRSAPPVEFAGGSDIQVQVVVQFAAPLPGFAVVMVEVSAGRIPGDEGEGQVQPAMHAPVTSRRIIRRSVCDEFILWELAGRI